VTATFAISGDALPADALPVRFAAREAISEPFEVSVDVATRDAAFVATDALGSSVLLTLESGKGGRRWVHGVIDRLRLLGVKGEALSFRLVLVPALTALRYREDCRIFQGISTVDAVKRVLADAGADERVEWRLANDYPAREYLVQYCESDLSFVNRLLEDEGLFYFFDHEPDGHTLIIADDVSFFSASPNADPVTFGLAQGTTAGAEPLERFERERRLRTTNVLLRDYDFEKPQVKPESEMPAEDAFPMGYYEYPAGFKVGDEGSRRAQARMRALRADADVVRGASGLVPGVPFQVEGAAEPCNSGEFVITSLRTRGDQSGSDGGALCNNEFEAIPVGSLFAPPRKTESPCIRGVQTAIVTGPSDEPEAIHVDEYGRVKVRFHWDRSGKTDDTSSCWLRVVQPGLGGSMILPRVGWEVAVAFEEGDPGRPFVMGRLYNGKHGVPVSLPAKGPVGSMKSFSTPGGAGANALEMDDAGGSQGCGISGAKDMNSYVGADKTETIAVDETQTVSSNLGSSVVGSETISVGANQDLNVGNAYQVSIGGGQTVDVGGSEQVGAQANYVESMGGSRTYSVGGSRLTICNGLRNLISTGMTRDVGAVQLSACLASMNDGFIGGYTESVGAVKVELVGGTSAEDVSAAKSLTSSAAELHMVTNFAVSAASVERLIGGVHIRKAGGNVEVSGSEVAIVGAVGHFKAGGGSLKLNGGPIVASGSSISLKAVGDISKLAGSLKLE
jgi:type VI secretion system secreted protein VgrG